MASIRKKKNLTVSLEPDLLVWVKTQAAGRGVSASDFMAGLVEAERISSGDYKAAMKRYFQAKPLDLGDLSDLPSRDQRYE